MSKFTPTNTNSGYNVAAINENFSEIADQLNNQVLYRDNPNGEPNEMHNTLDMNAERIINLPAPKADSEPVRFIDLKNAVFTGGVPGEIAGVNVSIEPHGTISSENAQDAIYELDGDVQTVQTNLNTAVATLATAYQAGDATNAAAIITEQNARIAADGVLTTNLNAEIANRVAGDSARPTFTQLAANSGSSLIGTIGPTAGAPFVTRSTQSKVNDIISVKDFGALGDGSHDDTAAIQAAIDWCAPFVWQGGTRATELSSFCRARLYFPAGIYRITSKIKLNPLLHIVGDGCANDWTVRGILAGGGGVATGGGLRMTSCIYADYTQNGDYAFDTAPYNAAGVRDPNYLVTGADSFNGTHTQMTGIQIENMTFLGRNSTKGLNMAGCDMAKLKNLYIVGFGYGIRWSGAWYSSMKDVRINTNWRGMICWQSVTDLDLDNVSVIANVDGVPYNSGTQGLDGADPSATGDLTAGMINTFTGMTFWYACVTGRSIAVENIPQAFLCVNSQLKLEGIYVEGCTQRIITAQGSDAARADFHFDTLTTNTGDLLWSSAYRITVRALGTNYTQGGFNRAINFLNTVGQRQFVPRFENLTLNGTDFVAASSISQVSGEYSSGNWTPLLAFGGNTAGSQSVTQGRWIRIGNLCFASFRITIPTLSGNTGNASIGGLPFQSDSGFQAWTAGLVSFAFAAPSDMRVQMQDGLNGLYLTNTSGAILTQSGFGNGTDIRGSITYIIQDGL